MSSGFRSLPDEIKAEIDSLGEAQFVFGAVKNFSEQLLADWTRRLELEEVDDEAWIALPPASTGRWSRWNITGREIVRRDLPKVFRSWTIEAPDFSGSGTHPITHSRDVFQKQRLFGQQIEAAVTRRSEPRDSLVGTVLLTLPAPYDDEAEQAYLYAASLARTWFGSATAYSIDETGIPLVPDRHVSWDFLPDGTVEDIREAVERKFGGSALPQEIEIIIDRLQKVQSLGPEKRLVGTSGLQRYIGYLFGDNFVAFENPRVGNALYLLYGDWESLSQLSRSELLSSRQGEFDRIIHTSRWFERLRVAVYNYRHG
ncbi:hypothetical protein GCM10010988_36880 [Cnuibacter physcomitrellae]|uniref:hypothetical protein n=1 Tax=Cnuibacter physcomitrellae TaxID=1619308 RepID=UPI0012F50FEE|nr:hypothetical protein [Cnuibacter physcomitrellae]GGI42007.1 hypothetical protein GCM10010988_36880 [Cnuibacter physcomitrellae]